jgi:hypothetical protein
VLEKSFRLVPAATHGALSVVVSPTQPDARIPLSDDSAELESKQLMSVEALVYNTEYDLQEVRASVPLFLPFLAQSIAHAASASLKVGNFAVAEEDKSSQVAVVIGLVVLVNYEALIMPSNGFTSILLLKSLEADPA